LGTASVFHLIVSHKHH